MGEMTAEVNEFKSKVRDSGVVMMQHEEVLKKNELKEEAIEKANNILEKRKI